MKSLNPAVKIIGTCVLTVLLTLLSNLFLPEIASVWGYVAGMLLAFFFKDAEKPFIKSFLITSGALLIALISSFLTAFLSQTELYTVYEYVDGSLTLYLFSFNFVLGLLLALISIYSSLPAKKKSKKQAKSKQTASTFVATNETDVRNENDKADEVTVEPAEPDKPDKPDKQSETDVPSESDEPNEEEFFDFG